MIDMADILVQNHLKADYLSSYQAMAQASATVLKPIQLSVKQLLGWKTQKVKPIDNINIPNINIPVNLAGKKRSTEAADDVTIAIRQIFNTITNDNVQQVKGKLYEIVCVKAQNLDSLEEIAEEMIQNFLIGGPHNIGNYMQLLNTVQSISILMTEETDAPKTIGHFFLDKCRKTIYHNLTEQKIRELAGLDVENIDQCDQYNKERDKIANLINTVCHLYEQRNTTSIKLSCRHLYPVMEKLMTTYKKCYDSMVALGDPYETDCADEAEYEILRKMATLYAEQLYTFMSVKGKEFKTDDAKYQNQVLSTLVKRFVNEIMPTLTESYLVTKCQLLGL